MSDRPLLQHRTGQGYSVEPIGSTADPCYEKAVANNGEGEAEDAIWLDAAYALESPEDNRALYARWAATYDSGFIEPTGYVYHTNVARLFVEAGGSTNGLTLDVGCGTGVVGSALRDMGQPRVDGIDISTEMLAAARAKRTPDGDPVYHRLIEADLTAGIALDDDTYGGVVSVGTFTHGHLGPEPIAELLRIALPGALFAIGINRDHYRALGFDDWFDRRRAEGRIVDLVVHDVAVYSRLSGDHADTRSNATLFRLAD